MSYRDYSLTPGGSNEPQTTCQTFETCLGHYECPNVNHHLVFLDIQTSNLQDTIFNNWLSVNYFISTCAVVHVRRSPRVSRLRTLRSVSKQRRAQSNIAPREKETVEECITDIIHSSKNNLDHIQKNDLIVVLAMH